MAGSYKVYISSTFEDLKEQRQAAARAVRELNLQTYAMQEDCTSSERKSVDICCEEVRSCDIYIGIVAFRYGYIPEGYNKSITQLEYEAAGAANVPRLLFLIDDAVPWPRLMMDKDSTMIDEFRRLIKKQHRITIIRDLKDFGQKVSASVSKLILELESKNLRPNLVIPHILPYLNNRCKQEQELEDLLCECESTLHQKPLIGIIHGDEHECHDKFIEKLQDESCLPKLLYLPPDKNSIKTIRISWPDPSSSVQQRLESFKNKLSQSLLNRRNGSDEEIVQALNFHLTPILIHSTIQAGSWQKHEPELIESWINFWDRLPDLAVGKKLLVFLCFHYKNMEGMKRSDAKKYEKLNMDIRGYVDTLNLKKYTNINGLVLTELCRITYEELDDWITNWAAVYCDAELLRYKIDQYYKRQGMNAICMCLLAQELRELCRQTLKPGV